MGCEQGGPIDLRSGGGVTIMTHQQKPTARKRDGFCNIAQLGGQERDHNSLPASFFQQRARDLYAEALGLRGADRHAALSLSRHFGRVDWRAA